MAAEGTQDHSNSGEFQVHERNYHGFLVVLRRATIATAIVTAIVIYIIAN